MILESPHDLPRRVEEVLGTLQRLEGVRCASCHGPVCGHQALFNLVLGHQDLPRCFYCLASELGRDRQALRDELMVYVLGKECLSYGWRWSNLREGGNPQKPPACLWGGGA